MCWNTTTRLVVVVPVVRSVSAQLHCHLPETCVKFNTSLYPLEDLRALTLLRVLFIVHICGISNHPMLVGPRLGTSTSTTNLNAAIYLRLPLPHCQSATPISTLGTNDDRLRRRLDPR